MKLLDRVTSRVIELLRAEISDAGGREVLFIGHLDPDDKTVFDIVVGARGTFEMVPALVPQMERGDVVIHNHPSGNLHPSKADLAVANGLGQQGIGFWIIDNQAENVYAVSEPVFREPQKPLNIDTVLAVLAPQGPFSRLLKNYEVRENQVGLMRLFAQGLNQNAIVSAEAGTGVGKSFAYLIPALMWVSTNKERVVIATATINLQQQIFEKDLPFVQKALGTQVRAVLVKGRRNYLCPSRLADELRDPADPTTLENLHRIFEWSQVSKSGELQDLGFSPDDSLWSRVCSDADLCTGVRCAHSDGCFLAKARKEAAGAAILVVNHHLLFADLSLRVAGFGFEATAVLPPFHRMILDEAHNLEKSATSYFSWEFSRTTLQKQLHRLYRKRRNIEIGLIVSLRGVFTQDVNFGEVPHLLAQIGSAVDQTDRLLLDELKTESSLRLTEIHLGWWQDVLLPCLVGVQVPLLRLIHLCLQISDFWEDQEDRPPEVNELRTVQHRLEALSEVLDRFKGWKDDAENVFWFQKAQDQQGSVYVTWIISPLSVQGVFNEAVFQPFQSVLLTSATLTVQKKFTFWGTRLGLDRVEPERRLFGIFPSPFNYRDRVLLGIPTDFPSPDSPAYQTALQSYLVPLLTAAGGSALVLFTSYESLRKAYSEVAPLMAQQGIAVYRQGDEDRSRLLARFKAEVSSVLFATDSFWEGVDSPGETLTLVVICRLPFRVPSEPVLAARLEALEKQGHNAFFTYSLPEAVTKFQQGFGRLIRHTTDYGVIVVLDTRLIQKAYGKTFLGSIPETQQIFAHSAVITQKTGDFLSGWKTNPIFTPLSQD